MSYSHSAAADAGHFWEPQVFNIVCDLSTRLPYLRPSCSLSVFLREAGHVSAESVNEMPGKSAGKKKDSLGHDRASNLRLHITIQHPNLGWAGFQVHPALDMLWLGPETEHGLMDGVAASYGEQLDHVENVLVRADGLWADLGHAAEVLVSLRCLRVIYVWLDGHRGKVKQTMQALMARDQELVQGRGWQVEYIDTNCKTHGTLS